ncbi:MAG: hypothetical protein ACOYXT_20515 [Bacteroidota bacterium]
MTVAGKNVEFTPLNQSWDKLYLYFWLVIALHLMPLAHKQTLLRLLHFQIEDNPYE